MCISSKTLKEVLKYLEQLPCSKVAPMKSGSDIIGDVTVLAVERAVEHVVVREHEYNPTLSRVSSW